MNSIIIKIKEVFISKEKTFDLIGDVLVLINSLSIPLLTYGSYNTVALAFQILFYIYVAFLFFCKKIIPINRVLLIFILWVLSIGISLIFNGFNSGYFTIASSSLLFLSFYLYCSISKKPKKIILMFYLGYAITALIFLLRYFFQFGLQVVDRTLLNNFLGTINVNSYSPIFTIGVLLGLYFLILNRKKWLLLLSNLLIIGIFLISGLLTGSRQFIVGIFIPCSFFIIYYFGKKKWYMSLAIFLFLFTSLFLLSQLSIFATTLERLWTFVSSFFEPDQGSADNSSIYRIFMIKEAVYLFSTRPLFGYGAQGYGYYGSIASYSHNTFSELLCNFGIFGFLSFELLLFLPAFFVSKAQIEKKDKMLIYFIYSFIIIQQMFSVFYLQKTMMVIVGILNGYASAIFKNIPSLRVLKNNFLYDPHRISIIIEV